MDYWCFMLNKIGKCLFWNFYCNWLTIIYLFSECEKSISPWVNDYLSWHLGAKYSDNVFLIWRIFDLLFLRSRWGLCKIIYHFPWIGGRWPRSYIQFGFCLPTFIYEEGFDSARCWDPLMKNCEKWERGEGREEWFMSWDKITLIR